MDQATLKLFVRQLAFWAENAISRGRSPFRKVETFPSVLSEAGELHPPLVFWINRDSCMAGGILTFPRQEAEEDIEEGRHCARALGLRHFVTWAPKEIVFWEVREGGVGRHRTIPVCGTGEQDAGFRQALANVMEELKVLSVTGALPPAKLSAYYLANLCTGTLSTARSPLIDHYRVARGEGRLGDSTPDPETLAERKSGKTLVRLLALVLDELIPPAVQSEGLERAMRFALDNLPAGLRTALRMPEEELPLPTEVTITFHHLFRRLTQLRLGENRDRSAHLLEILLQIQGSGLQNTPSISPELPLAPNTLLLHPDRLFGGAEGLIEIAQPLILALTALLRHMQQVDPAAAQTDNIFSLSTDVRPQAVWGILADPSIPSADNRRALKAQLRLSWPTRRFTISPRAPLWFWEFLHLSGLAQDEATIDLAVPGEWLTSEFGSPMRQILREQFSLTRMSCLPAGFVRLGLIKAGMPDQLTEILTDGDNRREIPWRDLNAGHHSLWVLALRLPDEIFALLEEGTLQCPDEKEVSSIGERGLLLFARSSLGRFMWKIISGGKPLPARKSLVPDVVRFGLPLPSMQILENLRLSLAGKGESASQGQIDKELSLWLGSSPRLPQPCGEPAKHRKPSTTAPQKTPPESKLLNALSSEVFVDGIPRFPEHYLYDYYRPSLREYTFLPPLVVGEEFLGCYSLKDRAGNMFEIEGKETARALLLLSHLGVSSVALPTDRGIMADILDRYLADLHELRRDLLRRSHLQVPEARTAERIARKIWDSLPLPAWERIDTELQNSN